VLSWGPFSNLQGSATFVLAVGVACLSTIFGRPTDPTRRLQRLLVAAIVRVVVLRTSDHSCHFLKTAHQSPRLPALRTLPTMAFLFKSKKHQGGAPSSQAKEVPQPSGATAPPSQSPPAVVTLPGHSREKDPEKDKEKEKDRDISANQSPPPVGSWNNSISSLSSPPTPTPEQRNMREKPEQEIQVSGQSLCSFAGFHHSRWLQLHHFHGTRVAITTSATIFCPHSWFILSRSHVMARFLNLPSQVRMRTSTLGPSVAFISPAIPRRILFRAMGQPSILSHQKKARYISWAA
jgi:hypothetical protein